MQSQQQPQQQPRRWGPGIRRQTPIIYRVTTGSLSEQTKATYQDHINDFLTFYKITDEKGIEPLKEYSPKLIRQMVMDFVLYLRDKRELSRSSIKVHCAALSRFFYTIREYDTRLNWAKVKDEFPPEEHIHRDRAYIVEEIQKMLSKGCAGRLREKAIILLLTSTGMRLGGIHTLKIGDLSPKYTKQGNKVYRVEVYSSSSDRYYCYCNVETAKAIDEYLTQERTDKGEILQNDSPLFRDLKTLNVSKVKPLTRYNVRYIIGKVVERSGIKETFQFTGEAKRSRGLRKYYKTTAENAGMKPALVELTHGHSIGVAEHYYKPTESEVLQDYINHAADALSVSETYRQEKRIEELEASETQHSRDYKYLRQKSEEYEARMYEVMAEMDEFKREWRDAFKKGAAELRNYTKTRDNDSVASK